MALKLGVTGSIGSGKSTVAALLRERGEARWGADSVGVIDADALAREVLAPGAEALAEVAEAFGADLIDDQGRLDRRELARRAFATAEGTARLNGIVHPRVRRAELAQIEAWRGRRLIVLDVPLLIEAGMRDLIDRLVVVTIGERQRFGRLRARGLGEREVIERLGRQMAQSRKAALADYLIDNSGTPQATRDQVDRLLERLDTTTTGPDAPTAVDSGKF